MTGPDELVLAAGTLGTTNLLSRIEAAEGAGFAGIGLRPEDLEVALDAGGSVGGLRQRLADAGLRVVEAQYVADWAAGGTAGEASRHMEQRCYELADALGSELLIVASTAQPHGWDHAVECFAQLCDRAADHGLEVTLEFLPWGTIPDAAAATRLICDAGRANAGVLLDSWHHFRGANNDDLLRAIPAGRINGLQISDARRDPVGSLLSDTRANRLFPGEGDFDLVHFVRLVDSLGVAARWSVEVLSDTVRAMPAAEAARRAASSTRDLLDLARR